MGDIKRVLVLAREYGGIAGAGGVQDVVRGLSEALARTGLETVMVLPCYGFLKPEKMGFKAENADISVGMDYAAKEREEKVSFWHHVMNGVEVYLAQSARFAEKKGIYTYTEEEEAKDPSKHRGTGHIDYFAMNILHQKAALGLCLYLGWRPDIVHCHDGHTAVAPALMREHDGFRQYFVPSSAVLTIHNAGVGYHQEVADLPFAKAVTGLPWRVIYHCLLNGTFDPLLAGSGYAAVNTVSENYARELQETELDALTGWLGHALKDRGITLEGVTNGIDISSFDPREGDRLGIPCSFDAFSGDFGQKLKCKKALLSLLSAGEASAEFMGGSYRSVNVTGTVEYRPDLPLFTVVSRLTEQKGTDILGKALEGGLGLEEGFNLAILGSGKAAIEEHLKRVASMPQNMGRMCVLLGYSEKLANLMFAGGDFFLMPSRYEPCGLTDFIAQLMGNIPLVRHTGGLVKVQDGVNGLVFKSEDPAELAVCMHRAISIYDEAPRTLHAMQKRAVEIILEKYTWDKVVLKYLELYQKAAEVKEP